MVSSWMMSRDPKSQGCDMDIFEAQYLKNSSRYWSVLMEHL